MERFFSNEPVRAIKQYDYLDGENLYRPLSGAGLYQVGVWYDAQQRHMETGLFQDLSNCKEHCMVTHSLHHGFHAWKRDKAEPSLSNGLAQWLEVELAGIVVEHEKGYRATRQRIIRLMNDAEVADLQRQAQDRIERRERELHERWQASAAQFSFITAQARIASFQKALITDITNT